jgi:hypothetical protein
MNSSNDMSTIESAERFWRQAAAQGDNLVMPRVLHEYAKSLGGGESLLPPKLGDMPSPMSLEDAIRELRNAPITIVKDAPTLKPLDWNGFSQMRCPLTNKDYKVTMDGKGAHLAWVQPHIEWKPLGAAADREGAKALCEAHRNDKLRGQLK